MVGDKMCWNQIEIFTAAYIRKHLSNVFTLLCYSFHAKMQSMEKSQFCTYCTSDYKYTSVTR